MPNICCRCGRLAELPAVAGELPDGRRVALCLDCHAEFLAACRRLAEAFGSMKEVFAEVIRRVGEAAAEFLNAPARPPAEDEP
jgi:hypothetical protein